VDSVGTDDEVICAGRTVCEDHVHFIVILAQRCNGAAKPHPYARGAVEKDLMKLSASDTHARTDPVPKAFQFDLGQWSSGVIQDALVRYAHRSIEDAVGKTECPEHAKTIGRDVQAGASPCPRRRPFDHFNGDAPVFQRPGERQARDSTANNKNP
jgi:hypothetical protein